MAEQLVWTKEVTFNFEWNGYTYKEYLYSNGIDGKLYRIFNDDIDNMMPAPTTMMSVGLISQEIDAVLLAERFVRENSWSKVTELLYNLPELNRPLLITCQMEKTETENPETGQITMSEDYTKATWYFSTTVY